MGMNFSYTDPNTQVVCNYAKVVGLNQDLINNQTKFSIGVFVSNSSPSPFTINEFTAPGLLTEVECEAYVIANYPMFSGATVI